MRKSCSINREKLLKINLFQQWKVSTIETECFLNFLSRKFLRSPREARQARQARLGPCLERIRKWWRQRGHVNEVVTTMAAMPSKNLPWRSCYLSHRLQASKLRRLFLADRSHDKPRYSAKILAPLDLGLGFFSLLNMAFGHMGCLMSVPWWMASFTNISFESTIVVTIKLQYTIIAPRAQQFKDHNMFTVVLPRFEMPRGLLLNSPGV